MQPFRVFILLQVFQFKFFLSFLHMLDRNVKFELTVSVQRASQPFASWIILHSQDLHAVTLLYTEVQFSSSMPVMPDSGGVKNLHLPFQLQRDRNKAVKVCN